MMEYLTSLVQNGSTVIVATHDDVVKGYGSRVLEVEKYSDK